MTAIGVIFMHLMWCSFRQELFHVTDCVT